MAYKIEDVCIWSNVFVFFSLKNELKLTRIGQVEQTISKVQLMSKKKKKKHGYLYSLLFY